MTQRVERPYDAEVEYLESSGGAIGPRIKTDYIPNVQDIDIEFGWMPLGYRDNSAWVSYFTAYTDENTKTYRVIRDGSTNGAGVRIYNGDLAKGGGTTPILKFNEKNNLIMYGATRTRTLNGVDGTLQAYSDTNNTNTLFIGHPKTEQRIYSFKLWEEGKLILDLIPVRKDGIGYLYNKADGKLYGNTSEDNDIEFILGPDLA